MYIAINEKNIIVAISDKPFLVDDYVIKKTKTIEKKYWKDIVGKELQAKSKKTEDLKVAIVCNWKDTCGISTYSEFLTKAIQKKVKDVKIFSEISEISSEEENVSRCWKRGENLKNLIKEIKNYQPDFIIIQHEFGIFPRATYFLQLLQGIENIPYVVTLHSVYEHLDKSICCAAIKNVIVHSQEAKNVLIQLGSRNKIFVIPHGCIIIENNSELWNIFQNPYVLIQFGFGFFYKGVDKILEAIHYLKNKDIEKWGNIFYCYLCSENPHTNLIHEKYYEFLLEKVEKLSLQDNVVIIRKFQSDEIINNYLRTAKLAIFPYQADPENTVYGASGAVRIAMANGIPTIASSSHQFDDLENILPRPSNVKELAEEIDRILSDEKYKKNIIDKSQKYIKENTWDIVADKYLNTYKEIILDIHQKNLGCLLN